MEEAEWLNSIHALPLLEFLVGKTSIRKLRLFACACCRSQPISRLLGEQSFRLIKAVEGVADGENGWEVVTRIAEAAPVGKVSGGSWWSWNPVNLPPSSQAQRAVLALASEDAEEAALGVIR